MTKNYSIGIDMGVNNVGWSILNNDTKKLENYGVRLFPTSNDAKERREVRNTRRRLKRKETRLDDTLYLLKKYGFNEDNTIEENLIEKRVKGLNEKLEKENDNLISYIKAILKAIKDFFRHLLQIGNDKTKEATTKEIKDYYDNDDFDKDDIYDIAIDTTKEDELFDYADIDKFYTKDNSFSDLER